MYRIRNRMYLQFFQIREFPFNVTPDPRFLFFSNRHREAFDALLYGVEHRKGFIILTGEVGCGKTTLCRSVLNNLPTTVHSALILNPAMTASQLVRSILLDLDIEPKGNDRLAHVAQLNRFLLLCLEKGENVAVIIDESQNLTPQLMEQIRMLSNLETDQHKLMQIILAGQPELKARISRPELRQLRQRVMVHSDLAPLNLEETALYIRHRLEVAGADPTVVEFAPEAVRKIHGAAQGIPRQINTVCDRAMLSAYVRQSLQITETDADLALAELKMLIGEFAPNE